MDFFKKFELAPTDPVFGLHQAFLADPRPDKVNLVIGSYKTEDLKPLILNSVKKAEKTLWEEEKDKEYLPISGSQLFLEKVTDLVFAGVVAKERLAGVQTIGGTGALHLGGALLRKASSTLALPDPTWDNHHRLFAALGFHMASYPYGLNFEKLKSALLTLPENSVVLLQGCCHNPTGIDPSTQEWEALAQLLKAQKLIPFIDLAYQGFGEGLEEDAFAVRHFAKQGLPLLVACSLSKNFGLYGERVGALFVVTNDYEEKKCVESQLKVAIRTSYSNPPCHGVKIVTTLVQNPALYSEWEGELGTIRKRLTSMRKSLSEALNSKSRFSHIKDQKGMFSYLGLEPHEVEKLRSEYAIYLLKGGRINVSGLNEKNLPRVAEAIKCVT